MQSNVSKVLYIQNSNRNNSIPQKYTGLIAKLDPSCNKIDLKDCFMRYGIDMKRLLLLKYNLFYFDFKF